MTDTNNAPSRHFGLLVLLSHIPRQYHRALVVSKLMTYFFIFFNGYRVIAYEIRDYDCPGRNKISLPLAA